MGSQTSKNYGELKPEECAQAQLDAYNRRDIEGFISVYDDDIEIIMFTSNEVFCKGKQALHDLYSKLFDERPNLHCNLLNRIICGKYVIDEEEVTIGEGKPSVHATAVYEIRDGLIQRAWFIRE